MPAIPGSALLATEEIGESRLPPVLAVLTSASLYATMPGRFIPGSTGLITTVRIAVPLLAVALLWPLALTLARLGGAGLPLHAAGVAPVRAGGLAAALPRLPLRLVHGLDGVQPDRHDAADRMGEDADARRVGRQHAPAPDGRGPGREHPRLEQDRGCELFGAALREQA